MSLQHWLFFFLVALAVAEGKIQSNFQENETLSVESGSRLNLTCVSQDQLQWLWNGHPINLTIISPDNSQLIIPSVKEENEGSYMCQSLNTSDSFAAVQVMVRKPERIKTAIIVGTVVAACVATLMFIIISVLVYKKNNKGLPRRRSRAQGSSKEEMEQGTLLKDMNKDGYVIA